jgi:hypothetical protein
VLRNSPMNRGGEECCNFQEASLGKDDGTDG